MKFTLSRARRSLAVYLSGVAFFFVLLPVVLYFIFQQAHQERQTILTHSVQAQGRIIAAALAPALAGDDPTTFAAAIVELDRFSSLDSRVRLLLRRNASSDPADFHIVAAAPAVDSGALGTERQALVEQGVIAEVATACASDRTQVMRLEDAAQAGGGLVAIYPLQTSVGCWAVVFSSIAADVAGSALNEPLWQQSDVQQAAIIYLGLAALMLLIFFAVRSSLNRFARLARAVSLGRESGRSFLDQSEITELDEVAVEFDRLVSTLKKGSEQVRQRAEDHAHALKTPIAIMRQSLVPLRAELAAASQRTEQALEVMTQTVERLDDLVDEARRLDVSVAEILDPPRRRVDLSRLMRRTLRGYNELAEGRGVELEADLPVGLSVVGDEEMIESAIEAVLDDVISATASGRRIEIQLLRTSLRAEIAVAGDGPRIPIENRHRIFDPNYVPSAKTEFGNLDGTPDGGGLRRARRKLQTLGGGIHVEKSGDRGMLIFLDLPVAGAPPSGRQLRRQVVLGLQDGGKARLRA